MSCLLLSSFSPSDSKFVTCSDDGTLRIWDFFRYQEERILRGKSEMRKVDFAGDRKCCIALVGHRTAEFTIFSQLFIKEWLLIRMK